MLLSKMTWSGKEHGPPKGLFIGKSERLKWNLAICVWDRGARGHGGGRGGEEVNHIN